jgi:hypothetical protein
MHECQHVKYVRSNWGSSSAQFIGVDRISKVGVLGARGDHVWRQCLRSSFHLPNRFHYTTENNCQKGEVPGTITLKKWGCPGTQAPMIATPMAQLLRIDRLLTGVDEALSVW